MLIEIIEDNQDYLIVNKPSGVIVHPGAGIKEKTLIEFLIEKYPELKDVGEDPQRPAIVHRLDKDVNGLMIIAKNNESFEYFKNQFKSRKIKKKYIALAYGQIKKEQGLIDFPIKRASSGHKMAAIPRGAVEREKNSARHQGNIKALENSRDAITKFKVLKSLINFTLLEVEIKTGRTHQIRVHFSAYGHPLLGDQLYGNKTSKQKNKKIKFDRVFLMAKELKFTDRQGEKKVFKLELSDDLREILNIVK